MASRMCIVLTQMECSKREDLLAQVGLRRETHGELSMKDWALIAGGREEGSALPNKS